MLKKIIVLALMVTMLPLAGFGCKGLSAEQQAATQPVTLEYWTVYDDVDALQKEIDNYKATRPYLTVNVRQLSVGEFYNRLLNALAEDKGPDIISVQNKNIGLYRSKLAPMPPVVADTTVITTKNALGGTNSTISMNTLSMPTVADVNKDYVQAVGQDVIYSGKVYGLPLSMDNMALYYNKDLLDKAGIAEAPKTWQDFQADVKKLVKFDKTTGKILQAGVAMGTANNIPGFEDLLYILFRQSGIDFVSRAGAATFNVIPSGGIGANGTPAMQVMNFYTDFADPTRDTYSWNEDQGDALDQFINGSLAFFFGYSYHYATIKARAPQLNFAVLPMLQLNSEQPVNSANYWIQTVTAKSKHQNEAWDLVAYLTHSGATKDYLTQADRPSALRAYVATQINTTELNPFVSQVLVSNSWYRGSDYATTVNALGDMVHQWLLSPPQDMSVLQYDQTVLERTASRFNQTL